MLAQKGGTGKTTLSIHLAVEATLSSLKTIIVDTDPQASATTWWRRRSGEQPALVQAHRENLAEVLGRADSLGYELAIIDTAPHSSETARASVGLSNWVTIPTRPAILDLDAIGVSTALVTDDGRPSQIVLNACPPPGRYGEPRIVAEAREALKTYGLGVCPVAISQRAAFSHALIDGRAVGEFDPSGKASAEIKDLWAATRQGTGV
jgi:chromosome partitioning protein